MRNDSTDDKVLRVTEVETIHGETLYKLTRASAKNDIEMGMLLSERGLPRATQEMIDEYLDQQ